MDSNDFNAYIENRHNLICKTNFDKSLDEEEKRKVINSLKKDIDSCTRLQLAILQRELRRTKKQQFAHLI